MNQLASRRERILSRLDELGGQGAKRSLGQNFLVSDSVVERIMFAVRSMDFPALIEVGPGLGALTEDLLLLQKPVTAIELDRRFAEYWRGRACDQLRVVEADALQVDWREFSLPAGTLFVSNLPYQISSSLVIERSLQPAGISRMVLMFQKEVAQRLAARAKTKEYGLLTVIAQSFWEIQTVCDAGPRDFFPPPNVASRVLQFRRKPIDHFSHEGSPEGFLRFVKAAFAHRRKLLIKNIENEFLHAASDDDRSQNRLRLETMFSKQGLALTARAEELDPAKFVSLYLDMEREGLSRHV